MQIQQSIGRGLIDSLVFIDPIRHYERDSKKQNKFYFDGAKILNELEGVKANDRRAWAEYQSKLKGWLSIITSESIENVDVVENQYRLYLIIDGVQIVPNLEELGTGVSQMIMLLSYLYLNRNKQLNVFIDEPESNLHPDAVIKLIEIFDNELKNHTFFITTHSSVLIDQVDSHWTVHRLSRSTTSSTNIYPCVNIVQKREVLDELGIRASQLLQANMIIWVEGPSDAIYVRKWISVMSNNALIAGKHYSFVYYGGSNLKSHDLIDIENENLVSFLCTSRYVVIFCDSDCQSQEEFDNSSYKDRVNKIISKLDKLNVTSQ